MSKQGLIQQINSSGVIFPAYARIITLLKKSIFKLLWDNLPEVKMK
jgi:hypothetical protein